MACAYLACVLGVIVKVLGSHDPVLIADKAISLNICGIELQLKLNVLCNCEKCSAHFIDQHLFRFLFAVDVGVVSVAVVSQCFKTVVLIIACAEAQNGEEHAAFTLFLNEPCKLRLGGKSHIKVAVGGEDNSVVAAVDKIFLSNIVSGVDACRTCC